MSEGGAYLIGSFVLSVLIMCGIAWSVAWMLQPMAGQERTIEQIASEWAAK